MRRIDVEVTANGITQGVVGEDREADSQEDPPERAKVRERARKALCQAVKESVTANLAATDQEGVVEVMAAVDITVGHIVDLLEAGKITAMCQEAVGHQEDFSAGTSVEEEEVDVRSLRTIVKEARAQETKAVRMEHVAHHVHATAAVGHLVREAPTPCPSLRMANQLKKQLHLLMLKRVSQCRIQLQKARLKRSHAESPKKYHLIITILC